MGSKVALVKSKNHRVSVKSSLKLISEELVNRLSKIEEIVIKVNFVTTSYELAMTPFASVEALVDCIFEFYKGRIVIAEEASHGDTKDAFRKYGFTQLEKKYSKLQLLDLGDDREIFRTYEFPGGSIKIPISKTIYDAPFLISVTRPKTHDTLVVTLGIKNVLVGAIKGRVPERSKIHQGKFIHRIMLSIANDIYPDMVVIDGTVGMQGDGPDGGYPIDSGWTAASLDALAGDSLAAYLMGFDVNDIGYLNMLRDSGFGMLYPEDDVKIIGEDPDALRIHFEPHFSFEEQRRWR